MEIMGMKSLLFVVLVAGMILPCAWAMAQAKAPTAPPEVKPAPVRPGVVVYSNLDYVGKGEGRQMLDLFIPTGAKGPTPLILWFHGGGWFCGDKGGPWSEDELTARGYAVASVNYRYVSQGLHPAQIEDCKAAIRYLRANAKKFNIDPKRVGVWGHSAGGHLAALLGTSGDVKALEGTGGNLNQSSRVQAVIDLAGPTDLLLPNQPGALADVFKGLVGGPVEQHKDLAASASSVTYVSKDDPPFLIVHGQVDDIVPIAHAEKLYGLLKKAGVDATLMPLKDTGHGGGGYESPENRKIMLDFFDKHLLPTAPAKPAK
jgi:acetyl esterase/lipase